MPYNITMLTSSPDLLVQQITTKTIRPLQIDYLVDGFITEIRVGRGHERHIYIFLHHRWNDIIIHPGRRRIYIISVLIKT